MNELGLFIQDDWRVSPKLTLNLGLRYDVKISPIPSVRNPRAVLWRHGLNTTTPVRDKKNFSPRFWF